MTTRSNSVQFGRSTPAPALATSPKPPQQSSGEVASFVSLGEIVSGLVQKLSQARDKGSTAPVRESAVVISFVRRSLW